ncbi:MAG: 1-acyl-sn-glycerol-3-phosphate acyltransferase, partial [Bacteroidia bacterium]|nr:1-acyl-sn-glycerol-3-phosphate acyltransferase [Bacteroidia bacterium]
MKKIENFSRGYYAVRLWVSFTFKYIFYRRTEVRGLHKFQPNDPLVFAPNHQNALMDALVFVSTLPQQPIFLARADIFKSKFIARLLNFLKMLPVYRIRDGFRSLQKNNEVFDRCTEILSTGHTLCLFPEGNHSDKRFFRPLKKGLARIAFEAEDQCDFKLGLKIIPTGIDYSNYENVRGRLTVSYADPITITDLKDLYRQDPQKAMKELNNRIRIHIEPHMIEIPWEDIYYMVMDLRTIYGPRYRMLKNLPGKTLFDKFDGDKAMIQMIGNLRESHPEEIAQMNSLVMEYWKLVKNNNFRDHIPANSPYGFFKLFLNTLVVAIGFPLHLYALINNYHLFRIPEWLSHKLFKDTQFRSTGAFVLSMVVMMPICYGLQTLIVGLIFKTWWIWLAYLLTLLPTGVYMLHYMFENRKWFARIRFTWMLRKKDPDVLRIIELRKEIVNKMDAL